MELHWVQPRLGSMVYNSNELASWWSASTSGWSGSAVMGGPMGVFIYVYTGQCSGSSHCSCSNSCCEPGTCLGSWSSHSTYTLERLWGHPGEWRMLRRSLWRGRWGLPGPSPWPSGTACIWQWLRRALYVNWDWSWSWIQSWASWYTTACWRTMIISISLVSSLKNLYWLTRAVILVFRAWVLLSGSWWTWE